MKKILAEIMNFVSHNTAITIAAVLVMFALVWTYGCESQVRSIVDPTMKVTRSELQNEVDAFLATADIRYAQLDQKDALKKAIFEHALLFTQTGTVNPYGVMMSLQAIIGTGAIVDNVTKRRKERKALSAYYEEKTKPPA